MTRKALDNLLKKFASLDAADMVRVENTTCELSYGVFLYRTDVFLRSLNGKRFFLASNQAESRSDDDHSLADRIEEETKAEAVEEFRVLRKRGVYSNERLGLPERALATA